jgi:hypothetical protein
VAAAARAQQAKIPRIGIIDDSPIWNDFRLGLRDLGYLEGLNIAFEYRFAGGLPDRLAWVAAEPSSGLASRDLDQSMPPRSRLSRRTWTHRGSLGSTMRRSLSRTAMPESE